MTDWVELARRLYPLEPGDDYGSWLCFSDYDPIIRHFGEVVLLISDDGWQGDTRVLYKGIGGEFGYLNIGWGSCSGCDALQSSHTYEEMGDLISALGAAIIWMDRADLLKFFQEHDWQGDFSWGEDNQKEFVDKAISHLNGKDD